MDILPYPMRSLIFKIILKKMGKNTYIDYGVYFRYPKKISIGANVTINRNVSFYAVLQEEDAEIYIGNFVRIAPEVSIYSGGHDYTKMSLPVTGKKVQIEDNVWIGAKAIILPGVTIGQGAVIGAGSVVTMDIPEYSIAVGNPARVLKKRIVTD
jgi:maltose O-acetyltransferase